MRSRRHPGGNIPVPLAAREAIVRLGRNESPYGLFPGVAEELAKLLAAGSRYPDRSAADLVAAIARHHGLTVDQVAVGAGSSEVCQQVMRAVAWAGSEVIYAWPSFEAYPHVVGSVGAIGRPVPLAGHRHDLDAMLAVITSRTRLVLVCNPNNPTSTVVEPSALAAFVRAVPPDVTVLIDEAYCDFAGPGSMESLRLLNDHANVILMRTFSKAYALAGLRVGYCLARPELAGRIRAEQVPYSVGGLAQAAAVFALGQQEELGRRVQEATRERERVRADLLELGYEVPCSQTNFVWLPLGSTSAGFAAHCVAGGVTVRPFDEDGVRVTVGLAQEDDVFLHLARSWARRGA